MRRIIFISAFFVTAFAFAQQTSSIGGIVMDIESNNDPLTFAKVSIKETGKDTFTDENGIFQFDNLADGTYTLVYSFVGYETREAKTEIASGKETQITMSLGASSVSLAELLAVASADKSDPTITTND